MGAELSASRDSFARVPLDPEIRLLAVLVEAHGTPLNDGTREPVDCFRAWGSCTLQHHALPDEVPTVDDTLLEDLQGKGLLDIAYHRSNWRLTPTPEGRELIALLEVVQRLDPIAPLIDLQAAISRQASAENKLAWSAVRPVLGGMRAYWEEGGFPSEGVGLLAIYEAVPEAHRPLFVATVRALEATGYLEPASDLQVEGMPGLVTFTTRTFQALDGWPEASGQDLTENLLAVLDERVSDESDPEKRRRLERWRDAVRDVGVSTASEVISKVLTGGI